MKKGLIASLFACIMLILPLNSVVGVSDVEEDCGCEVVNRYDLFRVKLLMVRIKVFANLLLLRFGYIPEVAEKCSDILENLDLNKLQEPPIICAILESIIYSMENLVDYLYYLADLYEDYYFIKQFLYIVLDILYEPIFLATIFVYSTGAILGCW